ncbi:MAG: hypothetical protein ACRC8A_07975 [Microcoleaceae cyanobacterium]
MEVMNLLLMIVAALAAGFGCGYWLWERRSLQQRRAYETKIRNQAEELEKSHQSRIQEMVQSLRQEHQLQLGQQTEATKRFYEDRLDATHRALKQEFGQEREELATQLTTRELELDQAHRTLGIYENRLMAVTQRLATSEARVQNMTESLAQYDVNLGEVRQDVEVSKSQVEQLNQELGRYEFQLQDLATTTAASQTELQNRLDVLEQRHDAQIQDIRQDLTEKSEAQIQGAILNLEQEYYQRIREGTTELVQFMQDPTQVETSSSTFVPNLSQPRVYQSRQSTEQTPDAPSAVQPFFSSDPADLDPELSASQETEWITQEPGVTLGVDRPESISSVIGEAQALSQEPEVDSDLGYDAEPTLLQQERVLPRVYELPDHLYRPSVEPEDSAVGEEESDI